MNLIALLLVVSSASAQVRSVFKGEPVHVLANPLKQMTFGLSETQMKDIRALSGIRFDNVFYTDHSADTSLSSIPGFAGIIYPDVPPPVISTDGDPEIKDQWWIERLGVKRAWPMATGEGVTIADCDAGFYHDEPDLLPNMLVDLRKDFSDLDRPDVVNDGGFTSHGTSVAAIIAGVMNGVGTNGIAYNSKIVPLQNFNYDSSDDLDKEEATAKCILHAITIPQVKIIVLENQTQNGSSETFVGTRDAVRLALRSGVTIVSAGGNYSAELIEEKKDNTGSIIVGAITKLNQVPYWSNFGERITVAAYGEKLHTLAGPDGAFADFGGTSGATPQVAATVAMMLEVNPLLTPEQARQVLIETRVMTSETTKVGGILDVHSAVRAAKDLPTNLRNWSESILFREQLTRILLNP